MNTLPAALLVSKANILTINGGSSSIKFSIYSNENTLELRLKGKIERIGTADCAFVYSPLSGENVTQKLGSKTMETASEFLIDWLGNEVGFDHIQVVGHRIVHGMLHTHEEVISDELIDELKRISTYDPDHLPAEIFLIQKIKERQPGLQQVACFDTSFHTDLPRVASMFAIPRRFETEGIRRYGFHGLSYSYLLENLTKIAGSELVNSKLILAHLGSGCSMAAVKNGKSIDTTMGFTPVGGTMMGTRPGDLDPGIIDYLLKNNRTNSKEFSDLINHQSGLLGVSETSADMSNLMKIEHSDYRAAEAIDLFCYQAKKWIGALTAALGGLDALVFTGGISENAPVILKRICEGLGYLGLEITEQGGGLENMLISTSESRVKVYMIPANEEYMIAKMAGQKLG